MLRSPYATSYDPFDSPLASLPSYLCILLLLIFLLRLALSSWYHWLPKPVSSCISILLPFISEDDLKEGRRLDSDAFLRRGAVHEEDEDESQYSGEGFARQVRKNAVICGLALLETIAWAFCVGCTLSQGDLNKPETNTLLYVGCAAVTWIAILLYVFLGKPTRPPIGVLTLTSLQFVNASMRLLSFIPVLRARQMQGRLWLTLTANVVDLVFCLAIAGLVLSMPVAPGGYEAQVPQSERERLHRNDVVLETEDLRRDYEMCPTTPEDYASLLSTLTYTWMESLQGLALRRPLVPSDIWRLRSINDTRVLSQKFAAMRETGSKKSLARNLIISNANDIALDFTYKICGVTLAYAGPVLIRSILECITDAAASESLSSTMQSQGLHKTNVGVATALSAEGAGPQWTPREKAFVLALLALAFTLIRYVAELKNFHHARQVGLRIRSVLVVELLEKALKRRDMEGAIAVTKEVSVDETKEAQRLVQDQAISASEDTNNAGVNLNDTAEQEGQGDSAPLLHVEQERADGNRGRKWRRFKWRGKRQQKTSDKEAIERQADVGKVVNMMAEDINTLLRLGCDSHQLYGAPIEVIIAIIFLYQLMGWSALTGFAVLVAALPLNYLVGRWYLKSATAWRKATDERISLVTELLNAIRFIKLQGVQERWTTNILQSRLREMRQMIIANMKEFLLIILWVAIPISCTLFTFYVYVTFQGEELTIPVAFTALTLFSMLRSPLDVLPTFAMSILRAVVSVRRLEAYLDEEEVEECISAMKQPKYQAKDGSTSSLTQKAEEEEPLSIESATFSWQAGAEANDPSAFALRDITIAFPSSGLCVIDGPTASGKSSLLAALLGEMRRISGKQSIPKFGQDGRCLFSFAGQTPWVEAGKSVRLNILFITPFDEERYRTVVHACALADDFDEWQDGDETRVSKETLSGGQKARISLARALYSHSHTVFLDDVLSAVDTRVQNHLYRNALTGPIAMGRRIVLVTHHISLVLPSVRYIVRLKRGRVAVAGLIDDLRSDSSLEDILPISSPSSGVVTPTSGSTHVGGADEEPPLKASVKGMRSDDRTARLLYDLEGRNTGAVKWSCYRLYLRASSVWLWVTVIVASILLRIVTAGEQYWLKLWGEASLRPAHSLPPAEGHQGFYLGIYAVIGLANVATIVLRTGVYYWASYKASKKLYTLLLLSVVGAKMRFFDRSPTGRILQRFNADFGTVDGQLPLTFLRLAANTLAFASSAIICIVIVPGFSVLIAACIGLSYFARGFLRSTMYMQRIEATSTSPLYSAFTQILEGLVTVRAFAAERYFMDQMQTITAITSAQWWAICTMEVWISFRSQIISGISVFVATCLALSGTVSPGSAGMVISSSNLVTTYVYWLTLDYKHLSNNSNSIERIKEYIEVEQEAPQKIERHPVPAAWPSNDGTIQVRDLCVRYDADLPEVLHSISFDVGKCEKIAIVGRTGSGKSSLISTFLRATEPSEAKSQIIIDGLDILKLGLEYRNRITIVPQDPVLFSGTIRQNLDPFAEKSDEECQWALDRVHINKHYISRSPSKRAGQGEASDLSAKAPITLETKIAPGGSNFSAGQAQLISLARALLRDARIVLLDEATSSTDFETDTAIQQSIREMRNSIIIAVAHRLTTVIDYDKVLVMDKGHIVEYDSPRNLLAKADNDPGGNHFKALCEEAGPIVYKKLRHAVGLEPDDVQ